MWIRNREDGPTTGANDSQPRIRPAAIVLALVLALPVAYGVFLMLPEDAAYPGFPQSGNAELDAIWQSMHGGVDRSFDGDGPINKTKEGVAIKGFDVVAYFTEERPVKGSAEFEVVYEDAAFRFASGENRDRFADDPEAYIPAFGGFCALGVSNGYKDDLHPEAFSIIDGRLYFNLTPSIHEGWLRNKNSHIERAEANWPKLRHAPGYGPMSATRPPSMRE